MGALESGAGHVVAALRVRGAWACGGAQWRGRLGAIWLVFASRLKQLRTFHTTRRDLSLPDETGNETVRSSQIVRRKYI